MESAILTWNSFEWGDVRNMELVRMKKITS
jgi:hypothetical protein